MKKQYQLLAMCASFIGTVQIAAKPHSPIITFAVMPYPEVKAHKMSNIDIQPVLLEKTIVKHRIPALKTPHLYATYGGNLAFSGKTNRITFPRRTQKDEIDFVVTQRISPIFLEGTNISHWIIDADSPHDHYRITRKQDSNTKLYFWDAVKLKGVQSKVVPLHSIVLFAKPHNVVIPEGITLTAETSQFILPPVYVKPTIDRGANAVFVHSINMFFDPIRHLYKRTKSTLASHIKT